MKNIFKLLILLITFTFNAQVVYVNNNSQGNNDGSSWTDAYTSLDTAINNTTSGQLWVAEGVYYPETDRFGNIPQDDRERSFTFKGDIAIYGGFIGNESSLDERNWQSNITILSGDIGVMGEVDDNLFNVVYSVSGINENSILDGLVISDGNQSEQLGKGAGVNAYGSFIVRNCIIENNYAKWEGGGMYLGGQTPIIENNIFRNNSSRFGGAITLSYSNAVIKNNTFLNNYVGENDGSNSINEKGGAILVNSYSSPIIDSNIFTENFAKERGGAVSFESNYHSTFKNNIVLYNESKNGGGLYIGNNKIYFFNNVIARNNAFEVGGAIYFETVFSAQIINNTLVYNNAEESGGAIYSEAAEINLINTIIEGNTSQDDYQVMINYGDEGNIPTYIRYCNIENGSLSIGSIGNENLVYENNYDEIPEFTDISIDDFSLLESSNLINSGNSTIFQGVFTGSNGETIPFPTTDILGSPRIVQTIDIGAYEYSDLGFSENELNTLTIYPNPTDGVVNIKSSNDYQSLAVYDLFGRELITIVLKDNLNIINLSNYSNGVYFIKLFSKKGNDIKRLLLSR